MSLGQKILRLFLAACMTVLLVPAIALAQPGGDANSVAQEQGATTQQGDDPLGTEVPVTDDEPVVGGETTDGAKTPTAPEAPLTAAATGGLVAQDAPTPGGTVTGGDTITADGEYTIAAGATGTIVVEANLTVTLVGAGTAEADKFSNLGIEVKSDTALTVRDVYIDSSAAIIDFTGTGGSLTFDNTNYFRAQGTDDKAMLVHVPGAADVTFKGTDDGVLYAYKSSPNAGFGSKYTEASSGTMDFQSGTYYIEGSKGGAVVGGGWSTESEGLHTSTIGEISLSGAVMYIEADASGAAFGSGGSRSNAGPAAGTVNMSDGKVYVWIDWMGSAVGAGGAGAGGSLPTSGKFLVSGGSFKAVVGDNAASNIAAWGLTPATNPVSENGYQQTGAAVTSATRNGTDAADTALYAFDADKYAAGAFTVKVDGADFYTGTIYDHRFWNETWQDPFNQKDFADWIDATSEHWGSLQTDDDSNLYFYLTKEAHAITVGADTYKVKWDATAGKFVDMTLLDDDVADIAIQDWTGNPVTPAVTVTHNGQPLTVATDYTVEYTNNTDAGTATATITGIGEYIGTVVKQFEIASTVNGGATITQDGTYKLASGATGDIAINANLNVRIVGNGVYKAGGTTLNTPDKASFKIADGTTVTYQDLYIKDQTGNAFDLLGVASGTPVGNTIIASGLNMFETTSYAAGCIVHVPGGQNKGGTAVNTATVDLRGEADSATYLYKYSQACGIGGSGNEKNGSITFTSGNWYMKGSKTGALIGHDLCTTDNGGDIIINGGSVYLAAFAQGASLGGSRASYGCDVYMNGGQLYVWSDFTTGIGAGGQNVTTDGANGRFIYSGGVVRTAIGDNAAEQQEYGLTAVHPPTTQGSPWFQLSNKNIFAQKVSSDKATAVEPYFVDTMDEFDASASVDIVVDSATVYSGGLFTHRFWDASDTIGNWIGTTDAKWASNQPELDNDTKLNIYLTKAAHTVSVGERTFNIVWDESANDFITSDLVDADVAAIPTQSWTGQAVTPEPSVYNAAGTKLAKGTDYTVEYANNTDVGTATAIITGIGGYHGIVNKSFDIVTGWDGSIDTSWYNTTDTGFTLDSPAKLAGLAAIVNGTAVDATAAAIAQDSFTGKTVTLAASLMLDDKAWTPIGSETYAFAGVFDGAGNSIGGLNVNTSSKYTGFFGKNTGTIKNFQLAGSVTSTGSDYIAGVAGYNDNTATIADVVSAVTVSAPGAYNVGGIAGFNGRDSVNQGGDYVEGGTIVRCANTANVTGSKKVGGIVGENAGLVSQSYNTATIVGSDTGSKNGVGGIAGRNGNNNTAIECGTIINCYNSGTVGSSLQKWVGGIAGMQNAKSKTINCLMVGTLVAGAGYYNPIVGNQEGVADQNNYSLEGIAHSGSAENELGIVKTEAELKAADFLPLINAMGRVFVPDTVVSQNAGLPVLWWQNTSIAGQDCAVSAVAYEGGNSVGFEGMVLPATVKAGTELTLDKVLATGYDFGGYAVNDVVYTSDTAVVTEDIELSGVFTEFPSAKSLFSNSGTAYTLDVTKTGIVKNDDATFSAVTDAPVASGDSIYREDALAFDVRVDTSVVPDDPTKVYSGEYTLSVTGATANEDGTYTKTADDSGLVVVTVTLETLDKNWANLADTSWYNADDASFSISTPQQLAGFAAIVNGTATDDEGDTILDSFANKTIVLANDISLADPSGTGICPWIPAGTDSTPFNGTFEGTGFAVRDMDVAMEEYNIGFIGCMKQGAVKSLTVAGQVEGLDIYEGGELVDKPSIAGGIVGLVAGPIEISNCTNEASVSALSSVGGIIGKMSYNGSTPSTISKCVNKGAVTGDYAIGGIIGDCTLRVGSTFELCSNEAPITTSNYTGSYAQAICGAGGIIGYLNAGEMDSIDRCVNSGSIVSAAYASGGIIGGAQQAFNDLALSNCYNTGSIELTHTDGFAPYAGGMLGFCSSVMGKTISFDSCYNTGELSAADQTAIMGALVGDGAGSVAPVTFALENCYYLDTSAQGAVKGAAAEGATPLPSSLMKEKSFVTLLNGDGGAYAFDAFEVNDGYPVFGTQMPHEIWDGSVDVSWYEDASATKTFTIETAAQLAGLAAIANSKAVDAEGTAIAMDDFTGWTFTLANDLYLNDHKSDGQDASAREWAAIAGGYAGGGDSDGNSRFNGTFDGNGHVINNIYIYKPSQSDGVGVGLFGQVASNAHISNLGLTGYIRAYRNVAGIVGHVGLVASGTDGDGAVIEGCFNAADVTGDASGSRSVAGIVGNIGGDRLGNSVACTVKDCYNTGAINDLFKPAGGIVGNNRSDANSLTTIENCYNAGMVTSSSTKCAGAIISTIGTDGSTLIKNCYWLEDSAADGAVAYGTPNAGSTYTELSADELSSDTFPWRTNEGGIVYLQDSIGLNDNYPILWWQMDLSDQNYEVGIDTAANGSIAADVELPATLAYGTEVALTNTPAKGYVLDSYLVNGNPFEGDSVFVIEDMTIGATFRLLESQLITLPSGDIYTLDASKTGLAMISGTLVHVEDFPVAATDAVYEDDILTFDVSIDTTAPVPGDETKEYTGEYTLEVSNATELIANEQYAVNGDGPVSIKVNPTTQTKPYYTAPHVTYQAHVQDQGWLSPVQDGAQAGTTGSGLRMEALRVDLSALPAQYAGSGLGMGAHIQDYGDTPATGDMIGKVGESKRVEAIWLSLTGAVADDYDVYYRVHVQDVGWMGWASNGEHAGTAGLAKRIESVQIQLVEKGGDAPSNDDADEAHAYIDANLAGGVADYSATAHIQNKGNVVFPTNGADFIGTTGSSLRIEALTIDGFTAPAGADLGIRYRTHIQNIGWQDWKAQGGLSGTEGQALRLEALSIELTGEDADAYDVYYRTHVQNIGWTGWAKDGQDCGSAGYGYRMEAMQIMVVPKGGTAPGINAGYFYQQG